MSNTKQRAALLAGSFDPFTLGHLSLVRRGVALFDRIVIGVGSNPAKRYLLDFDHRVGIIQQIVAEELPQCKDRVDVLPFDGLLVHFCQQNDVCAILRGLRGAQDLGFEQQLAWANYDMAPDVETVFLLSETQHLFISSSLCKEIHLNGGNVKNYLPAASFAAFSAALSEEIKKQN